MMWTDMRSMVALNTGATIIVCLSIALVLWRIGSRDVGMVAR
jgi:hypothetical protein